MTYPWNREATPEEIAEGNALFEAGWRGVSQRYRSVSLFEQEGFEKWLDKEPDFKKRYKEHPEARHGIVQQYLRCGNPPTKSIDFHPFRQVKRRENNWSPEMLAMLNAVRVGDPEVLKAMFPGQKNKNKLK
jgi:hypothetical protein